MALDPLHTEAGMEALAAIGKISDELCHGLTEGVAAAAASADPNRARTTRGLHASVERTLRVLRSRRGAIGGCA
jgi:hypothetical protein